MEALLPDWAAAGLLAVVAVVFVLGGIARARPDIRWLQAFKLPVVPMSDAERLRRKRSANRIAGLELAIAGLALPLLYILSTVMMFNDFKPATTVLVGACSVALVVAGVWVVVRSFK